MQIEKLKPIQCPACTGYFALPQSDAARLLHSKAVRKLRKQQPPVASRRAPQVGNTKTLASLLVAAADEESEAYAAVKRYDPASYEWELEPGLNRVLLVGILAFVGCGFVYLIYYFELDWQLLGLGAGLACFLYLLISDKIRDARFAQWRRMLLTGQVRPSIQWICLACLHSWRAPAPPQRHTKSSRLF